jgi:MFS family permease
MSTMHQRPQGLPVTYDRVSSPLQSPRLRRILASYTLNRIGNWFAYVALSLAVYDRTHSAIAVAALLIAGQVIPALVVPAVVARVEASRGHHELSALYVFEAIATAAMALLVLHFSLAPLLALAALDGAAALAASALLRAEAARAARDQVRGLADPALAGASVTELETEAQGRANAALNVAFSSAFMLGPALAGAVVASTRAADALFIDAAAFLVCAALLSDLRPGVEEAAGESVRERLTAAWKHVSEVPAMSAVLLTQAGALVFFAAGAPIEVAYAKVTIHAGDRGYGYLLATWGVGAVVGSILFARTGGRAITAMLSGGTLAVGLAYVGFAAAPSLALACLAAVLGGLGNGVQWASLIGTVQRLTPPGLQGQMMGAVESLGALCPAVGLALGGILVAVSDPRVAFLVIGLGATTATFAFLRIVSRGLAPAVSGTPSGEERLEGDPHRQTREPERARTG